MMRTFLLNLVYSAPMQKIYHYFPNILCYIYIYTHIYTYTYTEYPASFSNRPQEGRWDRNKHKSPLPFNDINNNRDINVCNTNESAPIETVRSLEV